jgi:hypothetical protein
VKNNYVLLVVLVACIGGLGYAYAQSDSDIPPWVRVIVGAWYDGDISDTEYKGAMEFLIEAGIIQINNPFGMSQGGTEQLLENNAHLTQLDQRVAYLESQNQESASPDAEELFAANVRIVLLNEKISDLEAQNHEFIFGVPDQLVAASEYATKLNEKISDLESENRALEVRLEEYGTVETREWMRKQIGDADLRYNEEYQQRITLQQANVMLDAEKTNLEGKVLELQNRIERLG